MRDKSEPFAKKLISLPAMDYVSSVVSNRHMNVFAKRQVYKCSLARQSLMKRKQRNVIHKRNPAGQPNIREA
jgi:hypothetical protein